VQPEVAYLRSFEGADVHALRLARPLRVGDAETAREVALYLDPTSGVPLQWQFQSDYMRSSGQTSGYTLDFGEWERWHRVPIPAEVQEQLRQRLVEAWAEARLAARRATGNGEEPSAEWLAQRPDPAQLHVPQEFRLPWKRLLGLDSGQQLTEFWLEQPAVVGLPEGALERPWMSGALWAAAERADHWDPPAAQR
jgi:hypothetical protein